MVVMPVHITILLLAIKWEFEKSVNTVNIDLPISMFTKTYCVFCNVNNTYGPQSAEGETRYNIVSESKIQIWCGAAIHCQGYCWFVIGS